MDSVVWIRALLMFSLTAGWFPFEVPTALRKGPSAQVDWQEAAIFCADPHQVDV
jgi:hypothetical protein